MSTSQKIHSLKRRRRVDEVASPPQLDPSYYLNSEIAILRQETRLLDQKINAIYQILQEIKGLTEKQEKNFDNMNSLLEPPPLPKELPSYFS